MIESRVEDITNRLEAQAKAIAMLESKLTTVMGEFRDAPAPAVPDKPVGDGTSALFVRLTELAEQIKYNTSQITELTDRIEL